MTITVTASLIHSYLENATLDTFVISDPGTDLISLPSDQSLASTGSGKRDVLADPGSQIS